MIPQKLVNCYTIRKVILRLVVSASNSSSDEVSSELLVSSETLDFEKLYRKFKKCLNCGSSRATPPHTLSNTGL